MRKQNKVFDVLDIYWVNKKQHKHKRGEAIYFSLIEIDKCIAFAKVDNNFVKVYSFYKKLMFYTQTIIPNLLLGLGSGAIATVMGYFLQNINDTILLTLSNLLFVSVGVVGMLILYGLSHSTALLSILIPYTVKQMEYRIEKEIALNNNQVQEKALQNPHKMLTIKRIPHAQMNHAHRQK